MKLFAFMHIKTAICLDVVTNFGMILSKTTEKTQSHTKDTQTEYENWVLSYAEVTRRSAQNKTKNYRNEILPESFDKSNELEQYYKLYAASAFAFILNEKCFHLDFFCIFIFFFIFCRKS